MLGEGELGLVAICHAGSGNVCVYAHPCFTFSSSLWSSSAEVHSEGSSMQAIHNVNYLDLLEKCHIPTSGDSLATIPASSLMLLVPLSTISGRLTCKRAPIQFRNSTATSESTP